MQKVAASIIIPVFNQEKYIAEAIESALNQKTDLVYEILVGDDASSDRTLEICKNYISHEQVRLIAHKQNLGLIGNYHHLFDKAQGAYIAILEGDDSWEENKLQEQVSFLEGHPEYGMIHSNGHFLHENGKRALLHKKGQVSGETGYRELFRGNPIIAVTACFRSELLKYTDPRLYKELGFKTIDYPLWLEFSRHTRIAYQDKTLANYRILSTAVSNHASVEKRKIFEDSNRAILEYFAEKYPEKGLDQAFIENKYHVKLYYIILYYGKFSDMHLINTEKIKLSRIKKMAMTNRLAFILYRILIRIFYPRI